MNDFSELIKLANNADFQIFISHAKQIDLINPCLAKCSYKQTFLCSRPTHCLGSYFAFLLLLSSHPSFGVQYRVFFYSSILLPFCSAMFELSHELRLYILCVVFLSTFMLFAVDN